MRLYKYISPILLFLLITGTVLNADSFTVNAGGYISAEDANRVGTLKGDIDNKISIANGPLKEINENNYKIVEVAYKQVGNVGGKKYWSWYGFNSHAAWCCCFVSWCADQCGFIDAGIIPKFAAVSSGYYWFKNRGQWLSGSKTPTPGMIVFFDFANRNLEDVRDGFPDHVGIVKNVKDGYVYCIEGNYKDSCRETKYVIGHHNIFGYGTPDYAFDQE